MELAQNRMITADRNRPLDAFLGRLRTMMARRAVFVRTMNELSALSTRELADIGISRSDIRAVARETARHA